MLTISRTIDMKFSASDINKSRLFKFQTKKEELEYVQRENYLLCAKYQRQNSWFLKLHASVIYLAAKHSLYWHTLRIF